MAGSPSTATELYSFRDVDGECRDIDRQSLRIRDRSVICTHAGWDYERRTDIIDTAENLLSKLIFHCVKPVQSRIDGRPGAASTQLPLERGLNGSDDRLATLDMRVTPKSKSSNLLQAFTKPLPIESQTPHMSRKRHLRFGLCWAGFMGSR